MMLSILCLLGFVSGGVLGNVALPVVFETVQSNSCEDTEMVSNGNFSMPKITSSWTLLGFIPGGSGKWTTIPPSNGFEIWQQGVMGSPTTDALGKPVGQSIEINGNNAWAAVMYEFNLPCLMSSNEVVFSFEYWFRPDWTVTSFTVTVEQQSKQLFDQSYPSHIQSWTSVTEAFKVKGCQPLKLSFTSSAQKSGGVHIDNVSLKAKACKNVNMVEGGSFEETTISKTWQQVETIKSSSGIWTASSSASTTASFTLWQQGAMGIPAKLSTGQATGQTLEINAKATKAKVGYKYFVPFMLGQAETTFSFEYFFHSSTVVNYFGFEIHQDGKVVAEQAVHNGNGCDSANPKAWTKVTHTATLQHSKPVHMYFISDTATEGGIHIDSLAIHTSEIRQTTLSEFEYLSASDLKFGNMLEKS